MTEEEKYEDFSTTLYLEKADLAEYGNGNIIKVDKSIFDDFQYGTVVDICFDEDGEIVSYMMEEETDEYIRMCVMELFGIEKDSDNNRENSSKDTQTV